MAFSPDSSVLVASRGSELDVWDVASRRLLANVSGHEGRVWELEFSPDGKWLASGDVYGQIHLWRLLDRWQGLRPVELSPPTPGGLKGDHAGQHAGEQTNRWTKVFLAFSPDSTALAWATRPIYSPARTGEPQIHLLEIHVLSLPAVQQVAIASWKQAGSVFPTDIAFSPDGRQLWLVYLHLQRTREAIKVASWDAVPDSGQLRPLRSTLAGVFKRDIGSELVRFEAGGRLLAAVNTAGLVTVLDMRSGQRGAVCRVARVSARRQYAFSADGRLLAASVPAGPDLAALSGSVGRVMAIWDTRTGAVVCQLLHPGACEVFPGAFSPDRRYLATVVRYPAAPEGRPSHFLWELPETPATDTAYGQR